MLNRSHIRTVKYLQNFMYDKIVSTQSDERLER